ncbi:protein FMC1 homolog [Egretta garzetta]|nr:protein FMC1 homolog [Egretta garzetta]
MSPSGAPRPRPRREVKCAGPVPSSRQGTSEKLCRAQQELHFQAATYLCLLRSVREHTALHQEYHGRGERSPEEVAGLVGFRLPQQPGGKG